MSYSIDANVLLYASDESSRHNRAASRFLADRPGDPDLLCLAWPTLMTYLRIATHPRIFSHPLSPAEALSNVGALLGLPRTRIVSEGEGFLEVYAGVVDGLSVRGNSVPDAHLAALLRQNGVTRLYTSDKGFRRFGFLEVVDPVQG